MPYVKLDCSILDSSIWLERNQRELFITALLMARPKEFKKTTLQLDVESTEPTGWEVPPGWYGFLEAAPQGIVHRSGLPDREAGIKALRELGDPDATSKNPEFDGRRLVRVHGGFLILNFIEYRDRDYTAAERQRRYRDNLKKAQRKAKIEAEEKRQEAGLKAAETDPDDLGDPFEDEE